MKFISVSLHNIRSYKNATVQFPDGIILLSGDIGSGKTTILLAMEFALFGLLRGEVPGSALLRNGANEGSVELTFSLNNVQYTIKRTLKRTRESVEQEAGHLISNGVKQIGTATELKSKILELLGYPEELLTKGKNYVYRYTVFTPQEDMKRILADDKETRVQMLRKVFDVDKYERVTKNAGTYVKALKERKRALDVLTSDFAEKQQQTEQVRKEAEQADNDVRILLPLANTFREQLTTAKQQMMTMEAQKQQHDGFQKEIALFQTQKNLKEQQCKQQQQEIQTIDAQLNENSHLQVLDTTQLRIKQQELNTQIIQKEQQLREHHAQTATFTSQKMNAEQLISKINNLSKCPTCLQDVTEDHKHGILSAEQQKMNDYHSKITEHTINKQTAEKELTTLKQDIDKLRQEEQQAAVIAVKVRHAQQLTQRKGLVTASVNALMNDMAATSIRITQAQEQLTKLPDIGTAYLTARQHVDKLQQEERNASIQLSTAQQKHQQLLSTLSILNKDLERKQSGRKQLERTQHVHHWLADYFVPLMDVMEKHVMTKIHHEFNTLFQQWFSVLIEDTMTARLDETFTPIIMQNGYDTDVNYLSGGERTACALAYRLALNKTINSLISTIQTKDLLILDEPTEGFSSEQLDKMRDVIQQLHLGQVIIVSHEQKIESIADSIIRISKTDHASSV